MITKISNATGKIVLFLISLFLTSSFIGLLFAQFNLPWGWFAIAMSTVTSVILTMKVKLDINFQNYFEIGTFFSFIGIMFFIYLNYSPIIEIRQDPSLYIYRAFKLIDGGYIYQKLPALEELIKGGILKNSYEEYANIQNGMQMKDSVLYFDFYPGGTYFYAYWGMFYKKLAFVAQGILTILSSIIVFQIIDIIVKNKIVSSILATALFLSPVYIWFGRGSYSEPAALLAFTSIVYFLSSETKYKSPWGFVFLTLTICVSYLTRYEYITLLILCSFLFFLIDTKKAIILTVASTIIVLLAQNNFWIYANRLESSKFVFKYDIYILVGTSAISFLINRFLKINFLKIYESKWFFYLLGATGVALTLLIFRENITDVVNFQKSNIHGRVIRTYNEEILERLTLIIPHISLISGFVLLPFITKRKELSHWSGLFILGMFAMYSVTFFNSSNSPQLYWNLRRYIYVIIPILFISSTQLFYFISNNLVKYIISGVVLLLTVNMYINSRQIVDYNGIDDGVAKIATDLPTGAIILYDETARYEMSTILTYKELNFVPIKSGTDLVKIAQYYKDTSCQILYLSLEDIKNEKTINKYEVKYIKQAETYEGLPKEHYNKGFEFNLYDVREMDITQQLKNNIIYPNSFCTSKIDGFNEGWTINGKTTFTFSDCFQIKEKGILLFERRGNNNPLCRQDKFEPEVVLNGQKLKLLKMELEKIYFKVPDNLIKEKNELVFSSNYFIPKEYGINGDGRKLGYDLKSIKLIRGYSELGENIVEK